MTVSPAPRSKVAAWLQLLAAWLVAILVMQGFQGALALGAGPRHVHTVGMGVSRAHSHGDLQRHHHAADDTTVRAEHADTASLEDAALALTLAMSLLACGQRRRPAPARQHVLRAARPWFCRSVVMPPPRRPPRPI